MRFYALKDYILLLLLRVQPQPVRECADNGYVASFPFGKICGATPNAKRLLVHAFPCISERPSIVGRATTSQRQCTSAQHSLVRLLQVLKCNADSKACAVHAFLWTSQAERLAAAAAQCRPCGCLGINLLHRKERTYTRI